MADLKPLSNCSVDDIHEVLRRLPEHFARPWLELEITMPTNTAAGRAAVVAIDTLYGRGYRAWGEITWDEVPFEKPEEAAAAAQRAVYEFLDALRPGTNFDHALTDFYCMAMHDLLGIENDVD